MEKAFQTHLDSRFPGLRNSRCVVAVSGGLDSVVLTHLLVPAGVDFVIAHCNFNLRGEESDADAEFVEELGKRFGIETFIQRFNTTAFAEEKRVSIQMAARELRYGWFEELRVTYNCDHILTAHHAQDDLETFLINLSRGSGLDGLTGIPELNEKIIRPLLPFSRKQILHYAVENDINWREDSSNDSDKYLRNHLRHHAIPALEEASSGFLEQFKKSQHHLQEAASLLEDYTAILYSKIVTQSFQGFQFNIEALKKAHNTRAVLYQLLKGFGFTAWDDIYELLDAQSGKYVSSKSHRIIKDRGILILTENKEEEKRAYRIPKTAMLCELPEFNLRIENVNEFGLLTNLQAVFDKETLKFPLTVRKWEEGDYFYPFGMRGKKKLSKFFKDEKFSQPQKETTWLLCSGEDIIWVIGHRTDNRYAVNSESQNLLKFTAVYD